MKAHPSVHIIGIQPDSNSHFFQSVILNLRKLVPSIGGLGILSALADMVDATPDAIPVLGPVAGLHRFYFAAGMSGHRVAVGPGAGLLIPDLIMEEKSGVDTYSFRFPGLKRTFWPIRLKFCILTIQFNKGSDHWFITTIVASISP